MCNILETTPHLLNKIFVVGLNDMASTHQASKLLCGFQTYDWGKPAETSLVASFAAAAGSDLSAHIAKGSRFAELWIGTHPSMPARMVEAPSTSLTQYLTAEDQRKHAYFSAKHQSSAYRNDVPYLLKVLSIGKALSIQAHPNKALAEELHKRDPKNYKDPNHKPELIVALTPFEGLCCFRKLSQVLQYAKAIPPLGKLLGDAVQIQGAGEADVLRSIMTVLYKTDAAVIRDALRQHQSTLLQQPSPAELPLEDRVFLRTMTEFPDDVGCWMVYILNLVSLSPGEALFLKDSEPHAYLKGDGVEIMATSDNVVRAGLTPKFIDVDTLLGMLTYDTKGLDAAFRPAPAADVPLHRYLPAPHVTDFSLYRVRPHAAAGDKSVAVAMPTVGLGICVEGRVVVNGLNVSVGETFVATPSVLVSLADGASTADVFIASTNDLPPSPRSAL